MQDLVPSYRHQTCLIQNSFFAEAVWADPQQRLILDVVSVLDVNKTFNSSSHGVYVGITSRDYDLILEMGFMTKASVCHQQHVVVGSFTFLPLHLVVHHMSSILPVRPLPLIPHVHLRLLL